jgi:hypothetical protein
MASPGDLTPNSAAALVSQILEMCDHKPQCCDLAERRLGAMLSSLKQSPAIPKNRARVEIEKHLAQFQHHTGQVIRPRSTDYRLLVLVIAKNHKIRINLKQLKKKKDIMVWFGEHWAIARDEVLSFLDNLEQKSLQKDWH